MSVPIQCSQGNYCPSGTVLPLACPIGTFNSNQGSTSSSACTSCPATLYCDEEGMVASNSQKKCGAGYLCTGGSYTPYPIEYTNRSNNNRKCPLGYYCTQGATSPSSCGTGTFQNSYAQSSCKICPPGSYCGSTTLSTPSGDCAAGYICYEGATTNAPTDGTTGEVCPIGSYCLAGSAKATKCADGTKTTVTTKSSCDNCDAGKYCIDSTEYACPVRRYCVAGSVRGKLCDAGTYNDASTGLAVATACTDCPARQYCIDGTKGSDYCEAGHICLGKSGTPLPTGTHNVDNNYICPKGRYCLKAGVSNTNGPTDCSASKYTYEDGSDSIDDCLPCTAGSYCPTGGYVPFDCPVGQYCVKGVTAPTNCPINTVRVTVGAAYERACQQCPGGYFCDIIGLGTLTGKQCSLGKFCPIGKFLALDFWPSILYNLINLSLHQ